MPDALPHGAVDAAEATLRGILEPWLAAEVHGSALDRQIRTAAACVVRDAGPHLAAAERERFLASVIGYRIGDQVYHPGDVTVVLRGGGKGGGT